ncbi:TRAP transporter substrate-binding protein [Anaerotruncus rubiinfantis]|uniref:TRAP transporter substrate-binding protein n=1 Tax=Anaerotruncus rubiinfantis TaxID=1720200 RepID=UPI00082E874D|nr:TRAP transporter substrate-binding protein [Anaerotruncus rubiinfantis]
MKKRALGILLAVCMTVGTLLGGCGSKEAPAAQPSQAASAESGSAPAAPEEEFTQIEMRLSHHNAQNQPIHEAFEKWVSLVSEKTGGAVKISVFPAASLYNQEDALDAVKAGALEMALGDTSVISNIQPEYALFSYPFLLDSYEAAEKVILGDIGRSVDEKFVADNGIRPLGWTWNGYRNICSNKPLTSMADCKGMKLRSPGADVYLNTFKTLGMAPQVISWSEAYSAMQTGIVDGVESSLEAFYTQGFYKLGDNICLSHHMLSTIGPIINEDVWQSLNENTQKVLLDAWAQCQADLNKTSIENDNKYLEALKEEGCNITEFSDKDQIFNTFSEMWDTSATEIGAKDILDQIKETVKG